LLQLLLVAQREPQEVRELALPLLFMECTHFLLAVAAVAAVVQQTVALAGQVEAMALAAVAAAQGIALMVVSVALAAQVARALFTLLSISDGKYNKIAFALE
jgi:hypothetical protein